MQEHNPEYCLGPHLFHHAICTAPLKETWSTPDPTADLSSKPFLMIMIKTQPPTPSLLRHDGMFYIGHSAINYFFDGSLFVMIINAGVPPPNLMLTGWKRLYNHHTLMFEPRQVLIWSFFFKYIVQIAFIYRLTSAAAPFTECTFICFVFFPAQLFVSFKK